MEGSMFTEILQTLGRDGGYALLLGVIIIMSFLLGRQYLSWSTSSSHSREENLVELLEKQLDQERLNADQCREMSKKTVDVLNKVAGVMGETNATLNQAIVAFNRNTEAFDRNTEAFPRFVGEVEEWKRLS